MPDDAAHVPDDAAGTMGRGVLRPDLAAEHFQLSRYPPSELLAPFVDYYWIPRWDLRGKPTYEQTILPHSGRPHRAWR